MVKSRRNLRLIEENSRGRTQEREIKIGGAQERQVRGAMICRGLFLISICRLLCLQLLKLPKKLMNVLSITMALREKSLIKKSKKQTKKVIGLGVNKQIWEILLSFLVSTYYFMFHVTQRIIKSILFIFRNKRNSSFCADLFCVLHCSFMFSLL